MFFVNVPICALALVLGYFFIPTSRDPDNRPLDPLGALLSIVTLVALLYAIIQAPEKGGWPPTSSSRSCVGSCCSALFAWWETHTKEPMIDVRVFRNPRFSAASGVLTLTSFALYGSVFLLTQYFQFVLGYSPLKAGLLAMPVAVGMMVMSPNAPRLVLRWGTKRVVVIGLLRGRRGAMLSTRSNTDDVVVRRRVRGPAAVRHRARAHLGAGDRVDHGLAAAEPGRRRLGRSTTPPARPAARSASPSSAACSSRPTTTSPTRRRTSRRRRRPRCTTRWAGRSSSAAHLPAKQGAALVELSREAFVDAMRITYPIAAAFIVFAAFIAWRWLPAHGQRRVRADDDSDEAREISEFEVLGAVSVPSVTSRDRATIVVAVAIGGALGTVARYELALAEPVVTGRFPWATVHCQRRGHVRARRRLVVVLADSLAALGRGLCARWFAVGFCGGLNHLLDLDGGDHAVDAQRRCRGRHAVPGGEPRRRASSPWALGASVSPTP